MCDCLDYDDGCKFRCTPCADEDADIRKKYNALGEAFAAHMGRLLSLRAENRGGCGVKWDESIRVETKQTMDEMDKILHFRDLEWECIFDVDRPVSEWKMEENQDLLEDHRERDDD